MNYLNNTKHQKCKSGAGITLIEILVVIFIMVLLSGIMITDFPKIKRQFAITRSVYKMSQDIRRAQDMGFSGEQLEDASGNVISIKGYGVYINIDRLGAKKYFIYADIDNDNEYDMNTAEGEAVAEDISCNDYISASAGDCVIETIDFSQAEPGVSITGIINTVNDQELDINFMPPNPTITITEIEAVDGVPIANRVHVIFTLDSDSSITRMVSVNTAGLIEIQ